MGRKAESALPIESLSYREIQAELKALGLPAKGPAEVLSKRLAEARSQPESHLNGETIEEKAAAVKTPSGRRPRQRKEENGVPHAESEPEREQYIVTTEVKKGAGRQSRAEALQKSVQKAFPKESVQVDAAETVARADPETPLQKAKRVARRSAAELQKSLEDFQSQIQKRKLGWIWPALAALLFALLIGSQWRHSAYWQSQLNARMDGLQRSVSGLYDSSQIQAARLGQNLQTGYGYLQDGVVYSVSRLSDNAQVAWNTGSEFTSDAFGRATHYLPSTKRLRALLPTTACSARLNATELDPLLPNNPEWNGIRESLHEAWTGLKDDPLKGSGVLLAGGTRSALRTAAAAIEKAVPAECKRCYLHIKGDGKLAKGGQDAAGELQALLASHLESCPYAIVHIEAVNALHVDVVPVLLSALSEQGSLFQAGKQVPAHKAIYIGSTLVPIQLLEKADEKEFAAAVKRDLVFQLEVTADPTQLIIPEAFRRRWDIVAPIRKSSSL